MQEEADAARAVELAAHRRRRLDLTPMLPSEPGEQRLVNASRSARRRSSRAASRRRLQPGLGELGRELRMHVAPLDQAQERHELRAARVDQLAMRQLLRGARRRIPTARPATGNRSARRGSCRCAWSAACARSSGRSRGSGTDSALAMTSASARQPSSRAASTMRPMRGSSGSRASSRPSARQRAARIDGAELLQQLVAVGDRARRRRLEEGKRVDVAELERRHAQDHRRERAAQDLRVGVSGRAAKSSSPYRRTQMPSCTRPQRPARWFAAACETFSICSSVVLLRTE